MNRCTVESERQRFDQCVDWERVGGSVGAAVGCCCCDAACECAAAAPLACVSNLSFVSATVLSANQRGAAPHGIAACGAPVLPSLNVPCLALAMLGLTEGVLAMGLLKAASKLPDPALPSWLLNTENMFSLLDGILFVFS